MIRAVLLFVLLVLIYQSIKVVLRSATRASRDKSGPARLPGEEMVLDPECRTYVVRERAVVRNVRGTTQYYCSEECARKHGSRARD
ncbi:MAG TPA: hypothetical protein VN604_09515 [Nitrospirota bacterium]|nr:hypothetical protein [Nitrospirota bacterium]